MVGQLGAGAGGAVADQGAILGQLRQAGQQLGLGDDEGTLDDPVLGLIEVAHIQDHHAAGGRCGLSQLGELHAGDGARTGLGHEGGLSRQGAGLHGQACRLPGFEAAGEHVHADVARLNQFCSDSLGGGATQLIHHHHGRLQLRRGEGLEEVSHLRRVDGHGALEGALGGVGRGAGIQNHVGCLGVPVGGLQRGGAQHARCLLAPGGHAIDEHLHIGVAQLPGLGQGAGAHVAGLPAAVEDHQRTLVRWQLVDVLVEGGEGQVHGGGNGALHEARRGAGVIEEVLALFGAQGHQLLDVLEGRRLMGCQLDWGLHGHQGDSLDAVLLGVLNANLVALGDALEGGLGGRGGLRAEDLQRGLVVAKDLRAVVQAQLQRVVQRDQGVEVAPELVGVRGVAGGADLCSGGLGRRIGGAQGQAGRSKEGRDDGQAAHGDSQRKVPPGVYD